MTAASSKWNLAGWTQGPVTLFQAFGFSKGTVQYPQLQASLSEASAQVQGSSSTSSSKGASIQGGSTGGGNTNTPSSSSETSWIQTLLTALNAPLTQANISSIQNWITAESPWNNQAPDGALYTNNPLNTKQASQGGTAMSNGIMKYTTAAEGIAATVATILQYPQILAALRSGNGLCGQNLASSFSQWSGGGYTSVC